ncbi:MAG: ACP phosphodiesterase [Bacteroidales bacterium]|nr:ACP phosphodiesterase [Bacteroidales bacterium]
MNYLAHIFLSGINEEILIGNFIGDYVKGKEYINFPTDIRRGIILHRRIDSFIDSHKIAIQSKQYFVSKYHKYAGIIIDICYDHFLIKNWDKYCPTPIQYFKENIFEVLMKFYPELPDRVKFFVPSFIQNDWIETYSTIDGIVKILERMSIRTTLPDHSEFAREVLHKYYVQLDSEFINFFPQAIRYVVNNFNVIIPLVDNGILRGKS